jgi:Mg-chelatase subunit ChlD
MKWTRFTLVPGVGGIGGEGGAGTAPRLMPHQKRDPAPLDRGGPDEGEPDIAGMLIALDASGSMAGDKFRTALIAALGCMRGLLRVRRDLRWAGLVFSNRTLFGGWQSSEDVDRVKVQLTQFLGGGTHIDPGVLDRALAERPGPIAVLLITDGAVANAEIVSRRLAEFVAREPGSRLLHLNIGAPNELTSANAAAGLTVQCIADERDLPGLALRFAAHAGRRRRRERP